MRSRVWSEEESSRQGEVDEKDKIDKEETLSGDEQPEDLEGVEEEGRLQKVRAAPARIFLLMSRGGVQFQIAYLSIHRQN